jgi:hypothetical protein
MEENKTVQILQVAYFAIGILSFLLVIWLNYRRLQELENEKQKAK